MNSGVLLRWQIASNEKRKCSVEFANSVTKSITESTEFDPAVKAGISIAYMCSDSGQLKCLWLDSEQWKRSLWLHLYLRISNFVEQFRGQIIYNRLNRTQKPAQKGKKKKERKKKIVRALLKLDTFDTKQSGRKKFFNYSKLNSALGWYHFKVIALKLCFDYMSDTRILPILFADGLQLILQSVRDVICSVLLFIVTVKYIP